MIEAVPISNFWQKRKASVIVIKVSYTYCGTSTLYIYVLLENAVGSVNEGLSDGLPSEVVGSDSHL